MQLLQRPTLPSIRAKLITLVLACAAPILAGYLAFAHDADQRERAHIGRDAGMIARALAAAVDRDLDSGATAARTLAIQSSLGAGDLAAFQATARTLLRPEFPVSGFELSGPDGLPLLDSRHPYGAALAPNGNEADVRAVFASGDAVTSGVHRAGPGQPWIVSITVPVWRAGRVAYALSVELHPHRLAELLGGQQLPERWNARVYDNHQRLVALSGEQARSVGTGIGMHPTLLGALAHASAGLVKLPSHAEGLVYVAYARTREHGWTVTIGYPYQAARELLGVDPVATLAGIAAMLALSLGLAWRIGGVIARSVRALTEPAAALGRGEALAIPPLGIREADSVAQALRRVEGELQQYRAGLESLVAARTAELQRSSAMLATVYATAPVGLAFLDPELRVVMVNDYLAAVNALPASAHIGHTLPELLGERGEAYEKPYRAVLASGRPLIDVDESAESAAAPGVTRDWLGSYYPVYGSARELVGINAVMLDITDRKRQEQRDRDNQELFRALFEGAADAHVLIAYGAGFVSANPAAVRLFGCTGMDELLGLSPVSTSPERQPDGRRSDAVVRDNMRRALDEGSCQFEWMHQRRDGSLFHADVLLNRVDIGGRGIVQGTIRDITARVGLDAALRAAGQRLEQSERMIRTVTDHLPALVGYWDADMRCRFANRPYLDWLGREADQVIGHTAQELMEADQMTEVQPFVDGVLAGRPQFFERRLQRRGSEKVIQAWGSYIPDIDPLGRVRGFYMLHADITELKRTQSRLEQALRAAEAASSAKGEFLANMSHEIRTPMNAIIGLARLLEDAELGRRERDYVARIGMASRSLLSMLNDVLDYSKVEAGQLMLEQTGFALDAVLSSIAVLAAPGAWNKGIEPVFAVAPAVPARLLGDPMRLEQVLLNLVGNAVKFTERGEVVLSIEPLARESGAGGGRVRLGFTVRDTGIGIAPDQQQRMFEAFSQADSSTSRNYGGTGLGLAISRRLVGLMGGALEVDSSPGQGASFRFAAWFGVEAAAPAPAPGAAPLLRVLVADDNESSGAALAAHLAARGWQVERAASGAAALASLRAGPPYDLAFIDCAMPDLDGASVVKLAAADRAIRMPRCALLASDPERERVAAQGADAILGKPFTSALLEEAIAELLGEARRAPLHVRAPLGARLAGLRVLVVEDNPLNQEVADYVLAQAGASADFAANGRIGLAMLSESGVSYDAVLMDLQMPVMDGFEATAAIRRLGLSVPVVAMSANVLDADRRRALAAGVDAWVAKPIDVDQLVATLAGLGGRGGHGGVGPAAEPAAAPAPGIPGAAPPAIRGIDLAAALPRFGGKLEALTALLRRFCASQAGAGAEIRACLAAGERSRAAQAAHRLRGVAANLGATEVAQHAAALEGALRGADAEAPAPHLTLHLARLEAALRVVLDAIGALDAPASVLPAPAPDTGERDALRHALALLLDLLQNNDMKAMARFEALRPALARIAPGQAQPLADAVALLRFEDAAATLQAILRTMEKA